MLDGTLQTVVLVSVWAGAVAGVTLSLAWITAPRWLDAACYLALGWVAVIALPELWREVGPAPFFLLAVGGALYSLGAPSTRSAGRTCGRARSASTRSSTRS